MNLKELKQRIEKSREFTYTYNGFTLVLRRPTEDDKLLMRPKTTDPEDLWKSTMKHWEKCIVGWRNVKVSDFLDDGTEELVEYDVSLISDLFDRNDGLSTKVVDALYKKSVEHEAKETEEKKI